MFYVINNKFTHQVVHSFDNEADRDYWVQHEGGKYSRVASYDEAAKACKKNIIFGQKEKYVVDVENSDEAIGCESIHHELDDGIDYMSTLFGKVRWHRDVYWGDREVVDENARDYDV